MKAASLLPAAISLTLLSALSACSSSSGKSEATSTATSESKSDATAKSTATASAKATAQASASAKPGPEAAATVSASAPAEPSAAASAAAPASASASAAAGESGEGVHALAHGVLLGVPTERSKIPTVAEWGAAKDIKGIPGNGGDLSECEIRAVREWLRISCRPFGGEETGTALPRVEADGIEVTEGKDGETLTFASGGVASVVWPLLDGKHREATVTYGGAFPSKHITLDWPHGAPGPTLTFTGMN